MKKYAKILVFVAAVFLLSGCITIHMPATTVPPTPAPVGPATATPLPLVMYITATPFAPAETEPAVNPTPVEAYSSPTPAPVNASININQVQDLGNGQAIIHWTASGDFPAGFQVVWSDTDQGPAYGVDQSTYAGDSSVRSALINGQTGRIYFVRVCRFVNGSCDVYSNLGIFALSWATPTPVYYAYNPTTQPTAYNGEGTPVPSSSAISITGITDTATGKARIDWNAVGTFANGFRIVYSTSHTTPVLGTDSYYGISDGSTRSAYVDGSQGVTYYYRICRYTGSTCDVYSNTYSFKFAGTAATPTPDPAVLAITSITNTTLGNATITWDATGTFPNGFKVVYSTTHTNPTLSDHVVTVSDGTVRTANITGDPAAAYYVRVCKYYNGSCVAYSSVETFTFAADPATISITGFSDTSLGNANVNWDATGDFPSGFKVMYSTTHTQPTLSDTVVTVSDGTKRTAAITGTPDTTYYVRVCKYLNNACVAYSSTQSFTFASDGATLSITDIHDTASGKASITWTASGSFPSGFKVLLSKTNNPPTLSDTVVTVSSPSATSATISGTAGSTYFVRVCKVYGSICSANSGVSTFTFGTITISNFTDNGDGTGKINWTDAGSFPHGFKVMYSSSHTTPTLSDTVVTVSASGATSADISATPGTKYYYRVCEWDGSSACVLYSAVKNFTLAQITLAPITYDGGGNGSASWTVAGSFPNGFLFFMSGYPVPDLSNTPHPWAFDSTYRSISFNGAEGMTWYFRVCQAISSTECGVYSNIVSYDFPADFTLSVSGDASQRQLTWTMPANTDFTEYRILRALDSDDSYSLLATVTNVNATSYTDATEVNPGDVYWYVICKYDDPYCIGYSNVVIITIPGNTLTPSPTASNTLLPTGTATFTPTPTPTMMPLPTDTPTPTDTETPAVTDTDTPTPSETPTPSDTPG